MMRCSLSWQPTTTIFREHGTKKLLISSYYRLGRATCVNTHESTTCSRIAARRPSSETVRSTNARQHRVYSTPAETPTRQITNNQS
jgi:hypothetical protein